MWELDCEESWALKNWCFWTWCWRRLLRVPWTARRSNQTILKEISPGISLEGLMLKLKLQYFGHLMQRVDSLEKTDAGRDWGQEEKGITEDEMAGWHHRLDGCESEWTPGDGDGQGGLACCDSWGRKQSDTTERLNWTELSHGNKWRPPKGEKANLFRTCYGKGGSHQHVYWERGKASDSLTRSYRCRQAGVGQLERGHPRWPDRGAYLVSSNLSKVGNRQNSGNLAGIATEVVIWTSRFLC